MRANLHKLVNHREATQNRPIAHMHMASQLGVIGKNGVVTHHAIVRQVHIGHQPVVVADAGHASVPGGTDVEGAELAHGVAVADHQLTGLTGIFFVLRNRAERVELEDAVVPADRGVPL